MPESSIENIRNQLRNCADVVFQPMVLWGTDCTLIYIHSIVDEVLLRDHIALPLRKAESQHASLDQWLQDIKDGKSFSVTNRPLHSDEEVVGAVVQGNVALFIDNGGEGKLYAFETVKYKSRAVTVSQNELVVVGPQEAFIEDIQTNLSLVRHRIKHPDLKFKELSIGKYTQTTVVVAYIEGLCNPKVLNRIDQVLQGINIDGVLGISYLTEQFKGSRRSLFPLFQYTERPDSVAGSLMEGRVSILLDGTPSAVLAPVTLFSLLQSSEDYYQNYFAASWIRIVRFVFSILSLLLPSLYVAITTFHPQIIPSNLLLTIASARENIPFSALTEALIMELTFEALREAGTRIPKPVGQTVSIIGGIVIGQAAVQAGIVSAPMVIVVSITGIASFIIPHLELGLALRLLRFPLLIIGGLMGLLGVFALLFILYGHLASLNSLGTPYLQPVGPLVLQDWRDTFIRVPSKLIGKRTTAYTNTRNKRRQGNQ